MRRLNLMVLIALGLIVGAFYLATDGFKNVTTLGLIALVGSVIIGAVLAIVFDFLNKHK